MRKPYRFTFHCEHCGKELWRGNVATAEELTARYSWSPLVCCDTERACATNPHALRRVIRVTNVIPWEKEAT